MSRQRLLARVVSGTMLSWLCAACSGDNGNEFNLSTGNDDGATFQPQVSVSVNDTSVTEGNTGTTPLTFTVTLSMSARHAVSVDYASRPGTASSPKDFIHTKGTLTFASGETAKQIVVQVVGDLIDEPSETIELVLANPVGAILEDPLGIGTIQDNDSVPAISVGASSVAEGHTGKTKLLFPISLNTASERRVRVNYSTSDGTAVAPEDYASVSGQLEFAQGETLKSVIVLVAGDLEVEGDETLTLTLDSPVRAVISSGTATGTIIDDDSVISGLPARPSNLTCVAPDAPTSNADITNDRVFASLPEFSSPLAMLQAPADSSQWYVAEQGGIVYRFNNDASVASKSVFLDLTNAVNLASGEGGLLGIAFHPEYSTNRYAYVSYTANGPNESFPLTSRLSRFQSTDNGATLDPGTEQVLLELHQPFGSHNGGHVVFGPDGYLYMGFGDGGGDAATFGNRSQNTHNLFGSVLRIDVDNGMPYGIPADNPFAGNALCNASAAGADSTDPCPEIYAWGFRNPWRFSFDSATGDLWLGDVGEHAYEEVNIIQAGGNYGWNIQEGNACFEPAVGCDTTGLVAPVIVYEHTINGNSSGSITGGFVYRGDDIPELVGRYFFVDFQNRLIFASTSESGGQYGFEILYESNLSVSSLAEDEDGELYGLRYGNGQIHKFIQNAGSANDTIPVLLSDTGCVDPVDPTQPAAGLIPYDTVVDFWSDSAEKDRHYAVPDESTVDVDADGDWQFPVGSILVKNFRLDDALIETRLFMRHTNGEWAGYSYEWNDSQTDAVRVIGGKRKLIGPQEWIYPSETQCLICHTEVAGSTLGLEHVQLNKAILYPATGLTANQLSTADAIDVLTDPLPDVPANLPALADPTDHAEAVEQRVKSYLHVNCSGCHRPSGPTPSSMDLRFATAWPETNTCDVIPNGGSLGILDARIIAPGDSSRSVLVQRVNRRDIYGMPPLGSNIVDAEGVDLLAVWIDGLSACP